MAIRNNLDDIVNVDIEIFFKRLAGPSGKAGEAIAKKMRKIL